MSEQNEMRIQHIPISLDSSWKPFNPSADSNGGSSKMGMIRRFNLIGNLTTTLFSNQTNCNTLYNRYSLLGLNTNQLELAALGDIDADSFWKVATDECGFNQALGTIKNNFSYVISRVNELLENIYLNKAPKFKINRTIQDWFQHNRDELKYPYGDLPKAGSIMCWKPLRKNLPYKIRFVESVKGSHHVEVSEYDNENNSSDPVMTYTIKNEDHSWGESFDYEFQGFIYVLGDIIPYSNKTTETEMLFIDKSDGTLTICSDNNSKVDDYTTVVFNIDNMKHFNRCCIKYEAFCENSKSEFLGNQLNICLTQEVWNCNEVAGLNYVTDAESVEFLRKWPTSYFPYKVKYDDYGDMIIPEHSYKHPYRYNGPYPNGMICLDKIQIKNTKSDRKEVIKFFDFNTYNEDGKIINSFDTDQDISRLIRNYPGYLCLTVKSPGVENESELTRTIVKIKEIILYG